MWIVGRIKWQGVVCLSRGNRQEGEGEESDSKERARHGSTELPSNINQPSSGPRRADSLISPDKERREPQPTFGQVLSIHVYVEVGSPFGHPGGAVMFLIGIVIILWGSRIWKSYCFEFILNPITVSL